MGEPSSWHWLDVSPPLSRCCCCCHHHHHHHCCCPPPPPLPSDHLLLALPLSLLWPLSSLLRLLPQPPLLLLMFLGTILCSGHQHCCDLHLCTALWGHRCLLFLLLLLAGCLLHLSAVAMVTEVNSSGEKRKVESRGRQRKKERCKFCVGR